MDFNIGNIIKTFRRFKNLTQEELALDICSVKQLSRIESNRSIPTAFLLKELSYKLGEDISDYFQYLDQTNPILSKERIDILETLALSSDFEGCYKSSILFSCEEIPNKSIYYKCLLLYKYTAALHLDNVPQPNINDFCDLLTNKVKYSNLDQIFDDFIKPFDYQVISSIILIYLKDQNYELAKLYLKKVLMSYENNYYASNNYSYLKALYNLSRIYFIIDKNYNAAYEYSSIGVNKCLKSKTIFFLDDFCLIKGKSLYELGRYEEGKEQILTFIHLSKLYDSHKNLDDIIMQLKEVYNL